MTEQLPYSEEDLQSDREKAAAALERVAPLTKEIKSLPEKERVKRITEMKRELDNKGLPSDSNDIGKLVSMCEGQKYKELINKQQ
jgi:hypothetical protein